MLKISSIIDLLAILPVLRFFRMFRALRFFRLLRLLRVLRLFKAAREMRVFLTFLRSLKDSYVVIGSLALLTLVVVAFNALGLYITNNAEYPTYYVAFAHCLALIGFVDDETTTWMGKIFTSFVLIANIAFVGMFISIVTNKLGDVMEKLKKGGIKGLKLKNHIILCGFSDSTKYVINEILSNKKMYSTMQIVLVTEQENPEFNGIIYVHGDYSDITLLQKLNIKKAKVAIVFAEQNDSESSKIVDMRTVLTVYNLKSENSKIHTIAEIFRKENAHILTEKIQCEEIIYKESIDSHLIATCLRHPKLSSVIYELLNLEGRVIQEKTLKEFNIATDNEEILYRQLKQYQVDQDITFIALITEDGDALLAPANTRIVNPNDRLMYIE
jgi:voltage-gated potassium channel